MLHDWTENLRCTAFLFPPKSPSAPASQTRLEQYKEKTVSRDHITPFLAGLQHLPDFNSHSQKTVLFFFLTTDA